MIVVKFHELKIDEVIENKYATAQRRVLMANIHTAQFLLKPRFLFLNFQKFP